MAHRSHGKDSEQDTPGADWKSFLNPSSGEPILPTTDQTVIQPAQQPHWPENSRSGMPAWSAKLQSQLAIVQ